MSWLTAQYGLLSRQHMTQALPHASLRKRQRPTSETAPYVNATMACAPCCTRASSRRQGPSCHLC
eukprot:968900-Alexandrium_andersonii.AAC.1